MGGQLSSYLFTPNLRFPEILARAVRYTLERSAWPIVSIYANLTVAVFRVYDSRLNANSVFQNVLSPELLSFNLGDAMHPRARRWT